MENTSNKKALKSGVWYTVANFVTKGAAFLTTPIFTRILTTEEVGLFSNFSSWLSILIVLFSFDLYTSLSIARFDYKDSFDEYIASNLVLGSIITIFFAIVIFSFKSYFLGLFSLSTSELLFMFGYFISYPAFQMYQTKCRIQYKYKSSVVISLSSFFFSTAFSLLCVFLFKDKYFGRWFGFIVPMILISVGLYVYLLVKAKRISCKYWKHALIIAFPLIWHTLGSVVLTSSDRVMITKICGSSDNALYSIAYSCAVIVQLLWTSMNTAWAPWYLETLNKGDIKRLRKSAVIYTLSFGLIVVAFMLIAPEVLFIMGGDEYASALYVIPPVMVSYVILFLYAFYSDIELFLRKQYLIAFGTILAALINVILNLVFIPKFGYIAAAFTTLLGYVSLFLFHFIIVALLKKLRWTNIGFNLLFMLFFIAFMFITMFLYQNIFVRWVFIAAILVLFFTFFFVFRHEIYHLIRFKSFEKFKIKFSKSGFMRKLFFIDFEEKGGPSCD